MGKESDGGEVMYRCATWCELDHDNHLLFCRLPAKNGLALGSRVAAVLFMTVMCGFVTLGKNTWAFKSSAKGHSSFHRAKQALNNSK